MRKSFLSSAITALALLATQPALAGNNLFLVWDESTAACAPGVEIFYECLLSHSDFNALSREYAGGKSLTLAGATVLSGTCVPDDFQCIVQLGGLSVAPGDVVLHYYGGRAGNGVNRTADVIVGGRTITINVATAETGNDCDRQTCLGAHEVFEAANDGNSADCCNGEQPPQCPSCDTSCAAFQGPSCYPLECGGQTYSMQYLSHAANEFTATGCTKLATSACNGRPLAHQACDHKVGESACCEGFACKPWSESGGPPFDDTCCRAAGGECTSDHDCCGAMHCDPTSGTCACTTAGKYCADSAECCAGTMCDPAQHQCVVPPDAMSGGCALASPATESANGLAWAAMMLGATSFMVRARRRRRSRP